LRGKKGRGKTHEKGKVGGLLNMQVHIKRMLQRRKRKSSQPKRDGPGNKQNLS